ncbi:chloride channel protein [Enterococcus casseliflavus]|uniref:chloride channel protein n=1 Tax=Enterococcus casseliflavus TaxID=37734 RepID=UPI001E2E5708|nr:chloride channel protein [Enterococcus casseliflavus]MCD5162237.1 chloride channel protein [Enterococcus casseliflavus]
MEFGLTEKQQVREKMILYFSVLLISLSMGIISHFLLLSLSLVSGFRTNHNFLLLFLPIIGLLTAFVYEKYGKGSQKGNNLIIESTQSEISVPLRMGLFTFVFTILTHLFGGSAGREGSAVQIGGVLSNKAGKFFKLSQENRRQLIHAGVSAGFSSIFGTPLAGAFFGMEMVYIGKIERSSLISCFFASYFANFVSLHLGTTHELYRITNMPLVSLKVLIVVSLSAVAFGIFGHLFALFTHTLKSVYKEKIPNYLVRALISSLIFVVFVFLFSGQKYEGLSLNLMNDAFAGKASFLDPIMKLFYTGLTLGAGFQGGEVTPLFDIGSTLGSSIGTMTGISPSFLAALGLISVFGCAANVPITTIMLGIDLFGVQALPYYALASFISYSISGHQGIYTSQTVHQAKYSFLKKHEGYRLSEIKERKK